MANEVLSDTITSLLQTQVLSGVWQLLLADRNALPNHPALMQVPAPPGSTTVRVPEIGLMGYNLLSAETNEEDTTANTALTDGEADIVLARYAKQYEASTLAQMVEPSGMISPTSFAMDALVSCSATVRDVVAKLGASFATTQGGGAGVDATLENLLDCITSLEVNENQGAILAILNPLQWGHIRKDAALNSGGAIQWNSGAQSIIDAMKGVGGQGQFMGVDIFTSTSVTASAGAYGGGVFTRGAIVHAISRPVADPDLPQVILGGECLFEKSRNASTSLTEYVTHLHFGALEGIDLKGVTLTSDD